MLKTSSPYHPYNSSTRANQGISSSRRYPKGTDPKVRRRIEEIIEKRELDKLFEL